MPAARKASDSIQEPDNPLPQDAASAASIRNMQGSRKPVTPPVAAGCDEGGQDGLTAPGDLAMLAAMMSQRAEETGALQKRGAALLLTMAGACTGGIPPCR